MTFKNEALGSGQEQTAFDPADSSVAIVGMACEFPGAHSPEELWVNVLAGRRSFRKAPPERLPPEYFDPDPTAPDKSYCDRMAVIEGWEFDPLKFRIPQITADASDITHWLALSTADFALKDSGLDLATIDRTRAGVMLGNSLAGEFSRAHSLRLRWPYIERALRRSLQAQHMDGHSIQGVLAAFRQSFESPFPEASEDTLAGNMSNTIPGRVCNHFDFGGGGFTVDAACASPTTGVVLACDALVSRVLDLVVAGGVDVSLDPFEIVGFAKTQALAREDIRPYDERANGMMTGEGCGIVVLMRENDARARGLRIHALIKGWAYSSDGKGGITRPEVQGQARALRRAYERAGYPMTSVGYIEGHGTGTPLGDKVELTAIQQVMQSHGEEFHCAIGSIKANIGHCKAAAGAAGLIKTVQALERKILPPTVNCEHPVNVFEQSGWKLRPSVKGMPWESNGSPRRASVSSMGFGGANSHLTLEEANPEDKAAPEDLALLGSAQLSELILLAAPGADKLREQIAKLIPVAERICHAELTDLAAALAKPAAVGDLRLAVVAETPWGLAESLRLVARRLGDGAKLSDIDSPFDGIFAGEILQNPSFVALFPGQGSQRLNMGERLSERYPFVRDLMTGVDADITEKTYRETLGASQEQIQEWESQLKATQVAQPAITAASAATLEVLNFLGLRPSFSIGHSLGEITALHAGGAFDARTAVRLAAQRGAAMHSMHVPDPGAMLAVATGPEAVQPLLHEFGKSLAISNLNSPTQTVVSGTTESIIKLRAICQAEGIRCQQLPVSHAFHSAIVAPAAARFRESLDAVPFNQLSGRVISTSTGKELASDEDLKDLLADHVRRPVRFVDAVKEAAMSNPAMWIEVGPGGVLTSFVREILGADNVTCLPTELTGEDSFHKLNQVLARAFVLGFPVATDKLFAHRFHRPFDAENYRPIFIVNPCERVVELPGSVPALSTSLPSGLLPAAMSESQLADYLANRGGFLRDLIALDFRHHGKPSSADPVAELPKPASSALTVQPADPTTQATAVDRESLLKFATNWIAKRTKMQPSTTIPPDKRLRDDLNIDSIKVGELVFVVLREMKRFYKPDPGRFSNSTLHELIDALLKESEIQARPAAATDQRQIDSRSTESLDEWVRTFRMGSAPAPIGAEPQHVFPANGSVVIVGDAESPLTKAIADAMRQKKLTSVVTNAEDLRQTPPEIEDLVALIVLMPGAQEGFLECLPAQFDERVEGGAADLFHVFRWALSTRKESDTGLRALVLRPAANAKDTAADFDAGAAFLKSLRLETANAELKWLTLPDEWTPEQWAATSLEELAHSGTTAVRYSQAGGRTADVAQPMDAGEGAPIALGAEDVALVSGGGKGITFEMALELARQTGCKLALLGSSPPPNKDAGAKENELARNLERLRQADIAHAYFQGDVTELDAVQRAVVDAERQLGPITAILHGAGITQLRLFREKSLEDFLRCVRIKTRGLYNLLTAVPPPRLKALHVITSVLGSTGMRGQADYTYANAWLDGAVKAVKATFPGIHCLSLGYSVWAETGLGERSGAVESLRAVGVTPISVKDGVAAYRWLLQTAQSGTQFVITGRLTNDLEATLYASVNPPPRRFLEKLLRFVPGTEIIADATLSHATDLYLREHVFEGTPIFPGVMAIEAMVQAAMACAGREDLPVLRNIAFRRPLIVLADATVVGRTLALAQVPNGDGLCVRVAMRSDSDGFQQNHFEAECWFGVPVLDAETLRVCPSLPEPLNRSPEDFSPVPLFQGKFFRRIDAVRKLVPDRESWTDVLVPEGEQYFSGQPPQDIVTISPAARDAFLQSSALALSPGSLPEMVKELRMHRRWLPGERLHLIAKVWPEGDNAYGGTFDVYNATGTLVERLEGAYFRHAATSSIAKKVLPPTPVPKGRVSADLAALLTKEPHALVMVEHEPATGSGVFAEATPEEIAALLQATAPLRQSSALANLIAARRAAVQFAETHHGMRVMARDVHLTSRDDGKPELRYPDSARSVALRGPDISLADGHGLSAAWIGAAPAGVDIEAVEMRDCEMWRSLLRDDGYALALRIERETGESFDAAATRVWALLEAGKKAFSLNRVLPQFTESSADTWLSMSAEFGGVTVRMLSALVRNSDAKDGVFAIALAIGNEHPAAPRRDVPAKFQFDKSAFGLQAEYAGPQDQLSFTKRFPVLFRDCQTASKKVSFTRYANWMGDLREDIITGIFPELLDLFGSGKWGLATNHYRLDVLGELSPGDTVEGKLWQERSASDKLWLLKCDWRAIGRDGKTRRVALAEMGFSAVQILGHGVARVEAMPGLLREFFDDLLPKDDLPSKPLASLPSEYEQQTLGDVLWQQLSQGHNKSSLFSHEIPTTSETSNWVGNIYFANYGEWMGRVRDLYLHRLMPDWYRKSGRDGEWVCLSCSIEHLSEAMPFDRIVVTMDVAAIHQRGVDLTFGYHLMEGAHPARKLAHGTHRMVWMGRDARNEPSSVDLPRSVVDALLNGLGLRR